MDSFAARACEGGQNALEGMPGKLEKFEAAGAGLFSIGAAAVHGKMLEHATASVSKGTVNESLDKIAKSVQLSIYELNSDLQKIDRWIRMCVPQAEDGNNWGVEVQLHVLKIVQEERKALKAAADSIKDYYKERADAIGSVADKVEQKTSKGSSQSASKGGEKDTNETKESSSSDNTTTHTDVCADRKEHIVAIDTKWYFTLQDMYDAAITGVAQATDSVVKNINKVKNPRGDAGDDGGSRPMHMY